MTTNEHQEPSSRSEPIVLAHRGLRRWAPENTLPAFAAAIEVGLSLELDVIQTSDGKLVVIHDETVNRTTGGTGNVTQMALADVRELDAGRWFHPIFAGVKVPTLEEVFQLIVQRQRTTVTVLLDMKVISPGIEENIVALVERYGLFDQLSASSPADSCRRLKEANPRMRTSARVPGWSYDEDDFARLLDDPLSDWLWTVDFIPNVGETERAHRVGKQVWLCLNSDIPENIDDDRPDTSGEWAEAQANRMDGICTDRPLECLWQWRMARRKGLKA